MTPRKALLLAIALGGLSLIWAATHYPRQTTASADTGSAPTERVALRFFKNPAAAPTFMARDLDGRQISLASLKGKVVLVNFWATWCPPCRAEIPDLIALQEKYRDRLQIIGISQDEGGPEVVKRFASAHHMNYPIVMSSPEIEQLFPGIAALPTSFIIDRDSRLVQKHVGMLTASITESETRSLAGLPVNASIEEVDQAQGLKLENGAQAVNIPGINLASLSPAKRTEALEKLNSKPCTCGCDLTVAHCRVDDPTCSVSLPLARQMVQAIVDER